METERSLVSPAHYGRSSGPASVGRFPRPTPRPAPGPVQNTGRRVLIVAWRDVASPHAGGSELLVDQLAAGLTARGDQVTLLCGGPSTGHAYEVVRSGGPYTQFLRAPLAYRRRGRGWDVG